MSTNDPGPETPPRREPDPAPGREPAAAPRRASGFDDSGHVKGSRSSALYLGLIVAAILSILILIFIIQNSDDVMIQLFGWEASLPTGVAILLAAVVGILIVAIPGSIRILQLRRALTRNEKRRSE
ncbi:lipopolysaccharide assembly LapA domain-containing protein [Aeromicrobium sp. CF4.19]|uniref:LapA family protein n=1 Tax=Aeromicrobium sp. CF4.19 TaxID=3373082 RepID=UPI003EE70174